MKVEFDIHNGFAFCMPDNRIVMSQTGLAAALQEAYALGSAKKDCEYCRTKKDPIPPAKPARGRRSDRPNGARDKAALNRKARRDKTKAAQAMPNDAPATPWFRENLEAYGRLPASAPAKPASRAARVKTPAANTAARPKQLTLDLPGKAPRKSPGNRRANQGQPLSRKPAQGSKPGPDVARKQRK